MNKIKLIYDFLRLWIKYEDRKEAWQDAQFINDRTMQSELAEMEESVMTTLTKIDPKKFPCKFDHNGECLICDCWISDCAYLRYLNGDYKWETKEELEEMFKDLSLIHI